LNRERLAIRVASILAGGVLGAVALLSLPGLASADGGATERIDQAACQGQRTAGHDCQTSKPAGGAPTGPTASSTGTPTDARALNKGDATPGPVGSPNTNVAKLEASSGGKDATAKPDTASGTTNGATAKPDTTSGITNAASGNSQVAAPQVSTPTAGSGGPAGATQTNAKQATAPAKGDTPKAASAGSSADWVQAVATDTTQRALAPAGPTTAPTTTPEAKLEVVAEVQVSSTESNTADQVQALATPATQRELAPARHATVHTTTPEAKLEVVAGGQVSVAEWNLSAGVSADSVALGTEVDVDVVTGGPVEEARPAEIVDTVQPAAETASGVMRAGSEEVPVSTPLMSPSGTPATEVLPEIALVPAQSAHENLLESVSSVLQPGLSGGPNVTEQTPADVVPRSLNRESPNLDGLASSPTNPTDADAPIATSGTNQVEGGGRVGDAAPARSVVDAVEAASAPGVDHYAASQITSPRALDEPSDEAAADPVGPDAGPNLQGWVAAVGPPSGPALYGLLLAAALVMASIAVFRGILPGITRSPAGVDPETGASAAPAAPPPDRQGEVMSPQAEDSDQTITGGTQ
jgi:hypothetical protein